ncbi:hypothetical protein [Lentzea albidocapillata]|uniref:Uncharacterized protein n=1 Tax=Lentzea albidocapillata TaxID=40571 RepID=A0A1W2D363_9PSEU|nr:hypothetical protein [Lentzea albidocapillata]SMC91494.1 hypothetical protein SAMN05660733_02652 [Lentzea albidocapillata]
MLTRTLAAVGTAALLVATLFSGSAGAADTPEVVEALPVTGAQVPGTADDAFAAAAATLPFTFSFQMCCSLDSRQFTPPGRENRGKACVTLRGTKSDDPKWKGKIVKVIMWDEDGIDGKKGPTVDFKLDGTYYKYCWTGLTVAHPHHFEIQKPWGPAQLWGDGKATGS